MSVDYAAGLSDYDDLGICGIDEFFDNETEVDKKVNILADYIRAYKGSCVFHVGAGISTAAGIPDFRGPNGVWTNKVKSSNDNCKTELSEQQSIKQLTNKKEENLDDDIVKSHDNNNTSNLKRDETKDIIDATNIKIECDNKSKVTSFDTAEPTYTHLAIKKLIEYGFVSHIISQNVDGLFLKSGIDRSNISELHGNFFLDECTKCRSRFIRATASSTMGLKRSSSKCFKEACRGTLRDTILDWESPIPYNELRVAKSKSKKNRLHICVGTTMQLQPANQLPLEATKKNPTKGKLVVINLQSIKLESLADLSIHHYADTVMKKLLEFLDLSINIYDEKEDPTKLSSKIGKAWLPTKKEVE